MRCGMHIQDNSVTPATPCVLCDILSLANSTLLPADTILLGTKNSLPNSLIHDSRSNFYRKIYNLTSCTPTKSNFANSVATVASEHAL
jgi:hypothetical protein